MVTAAALWDLVGLTHVTTAAQALRADQEPLQIDLPLASLLPDKGLPRGAVIELAAPDGLGRATAIALAACASAQQNGRLHHGESDWCAWVDPDETLYAPAVRASGVDLHRLLVVRPPRSWAARAAVAIAEAGVLSVIVIDVSSMPGAHASGALAPGAVPLTPWAKVVRRLSLAVERSPTTVILLTDANAPRSVALPVAMRIEIEREQGGLVSVRIAKEKHGRIGESHHIAWTRPEADLGSRTG